MSNITPVNPIVIEDELSRMALFKHNPSGMVNNYLNMVENIYEGRVKILEPNNPISMVLEINAVGTVFGIQEHLIYLRKLYPALANTEDDLDRHMSDRDHVNRYSSPAWGKVTFNIMLNDFLSKAKVDPYNKDKYVVIPRYTNVSIGDYVFTLPASVIVRVTESGIPDVRYDGDVIDDLFPIRTNYIKFYQLAYNQKETYLTFELDLPEIDVSPSTVMLKRGTIVKGDINFKEDRKFFYAKAFYIDQFTGEWIEMKTTHTEDVWDINEPTCILKVDALNSKVSYYIPPLYINQFDMGDKVKIVLYTTRGSIDVNFNDYRVDEFELNYNDVFPDIEVGNEPSPLKNINIQPYMLGKVVGGKNGKNFRELKQDVINNNLVPNLPITDNQIETTLRGTELEPIKNHDVVTGREFLIKVKIPSSVSKYEIARASLDLIEFKTSFEDLCKDTNSIIPIDKNILVIPRGTMFKVGGVDGVKALTPSEKKDLESLSGQRLTVAVNNNNYMALYYHYVLDDIDEHTELRAYDVDHPKVIRSNFKNYNNTTLVSVNSRSLVVTRTDKGYRLDVLIEHQKFNDMYDVTNVLPVLMYESDSGFRYYLEGKLSNNTVQGKIVSFYLETDCYIDRQNRIHINNFKDTNGNILRMYFDIEQDLSILYCTDAMPSKYQATAMDEYLHGSFLAGRYGVITHEIHTIEFALNHVGLYRRVHTSTGLDQYQTYTNDVYMTYTSTVFDKNNKVIHKPGDFVLDDKGNKIITFKAGEVKLDDKGEPIRIGRKDLARFLNLLLIDYKFTLDNTRLTREYMNDVKLHLETIIHNNVRRNREDLLEITESFMTVPNGLTDIMVRYDGKTGYIKPNQAFRFEVNVSDRVANDDATRKQLELAVKDILDKYLTGRKILKRNDIESRIREHLGDVVSGISLISLTELNANYIEILNDNGEVSINKRLTITPTGYRVIDDVSFDYIRNRMDSVVSNKALNDNEMKI